MMMNRDKLSFWMRLVAIVLAVFFVGSFVVLGLGGNVSYNLFELIGGSDQQQGGQTTDPQEQIEQAERELEANPKERKVLARNPVNELTRASLSISGGQVFQRTYEHLYCFE